MFWWRVVGVACDRNRSDEGFLKLTTLAADLERVATILVVTIYICRKVSQ